MRKRKWLVASVVAVGMVAGMQVQALAEPRSDKPDRSQPVLTEETAGAPPAGFASWSELMKVQQRLDARAERIMAERDGSFSGIEVAAEERLLTVHWKGRPPAKAAAAIEDARRDDMRVEVREARYSEDELMAEGDRIFQQDGVSAVAPEVDGSGLLVSMLPWRLGVIFSPIPLTTDEADPRAASRSDDSSPYWGGARWNGCSNGFAISIGGSRKMLSAGHCGSNGQIARDGGGQTMGTVAGDSNSFDRLHIDTTDNTKVIAKGTHTAIDLATVRPCTGVPTGVNGRQCAWRFWYVDVTRSLSAYGAKIVTG